MNTPSDPARCPLCGQSNQCSLADPARADMDCWCFSAKIDPAVLESIPPQDIDRACLCPRCAQALPPTHQTDAP
ncbi:cysteine-rich CWC family protein [Pseudomonas sp. Q1-7]|uniref:cysteine-rich CWC family protein n=1 Tax=Pseudomonas sp. Q1-7 TaxID=3020843 RepID=UPI002301AE4E|nr:cysteine-rich CWC family protein [Pseudomonas sp. Q1-7]